MTFRKYLFTLSLAMRTPQAATNKKGYTLVEVAVGMTLLMMVLGSGFGAYIMGLRFAKNSRDTLRATQFAESKMEELRTKNWGDLESMPQWSLFFADPSYAPDHMDDFIGVLQIWEQNSEQKFIRCWAYWPNPHSSNYKSAHFDTVYTKDGLNDYFVRAF